MERELKEKGDEGGDKGDKRGDKGDKSGDKGDKSGNNKPIEIDDDDDDDIIEIKEDVIEIKDDDNDNDNDINVIEIDDDIDINIKTEKTPPSPIIISLDNTFSWKGQDIHATGEITNKDGTTSAIYDLTSIDDDNNMIQDVRKHNFIDLIGNNVESLNHNYGMYMLLTLYSIKHINIM